jgi:hypothetical protein
MSHSFTIYSRKLCLSASVLAIMAAVPASAQTTVLTSSSANYDLLTHAGTDQYVEVSSGTNAYLIRGGSYGYSDSGTPVATTGGVDILYTIGGGWQNGIASTGSGAGSSDLSWFYVPSNAPAIKVDSGATLTVAGTEVTGSSENFYFFSMFQGGGGEVRFGEGRWTLWGANSFTDLTLQNNATARFGGSYTAWGCCGNGTSGSNTVSGWLAGASTSTLQVDGGSLIMNGVNTAAHAFTGTVNVNSGGTFTVGDSSHTSAVFGDPAGRTAQINVNGTGILTGYGTIYGNVTSGGVIRPGGTSGVNGGLTINGNLTLTDNSILRASMSPTGVNGLTVNGNMVAAGEMDIDITSGSYGNGVYPILVVNGGSITGTFTRVLTTGSTGDVIVGVKQSSGGYTIVTEEGSSPQVYGHVLYANRLALTNFVGSLYDAMAMTPSSGAMIDTWGTVNGGIVNLGRDGLGFNEKSYGLSVGGMHRFAQHGGVVGAAFSYRHGSMSVKDSTATASTNGYDFGIYGGAEVNQVRFDGTAFYSINTVDASRPMGSSYGTSKSSGDGYSYGVSGEISRNVFGGLLTPYVRGLYARVHLAAVAETGSLQFDLKHDGMNANTFVTDLGLRVHLLRPQGDQRFRIDANLAWRYDLSDPGETAVVGFANFTGGDNTFFWKGDSKHALVVGLDGTGRVADGLEVYGRLNGILTSYRRAGELSLGVKYKF